MTFDAPLYEAQAAAEIATMCRHIDSLDDYREKPSHIGILDDVHGIVIHELDKPGARALAYRLLQLADELPDPPRILRRPQAVDDHLREQE